MTGYLRIFRRVQGLRHDANKQPGRDSLGWRPTLKKLWELFGVEYGYGYVGGVGCYLCDPGHPYTFGEGGVRRA